MAFSGEEQGLYGSSFAAQQVKRVKQREKERGVRRRGVVYVFFV